VLLLTGWCFCFAGTGEEFSALCSLVLFLIRFGSSRNEAVASWLFKADAAAMLHNFEHVLHQVAADGDSR
jgi:hypothetical protein